MLFLKAFLPSYRSFFQALNLPSLVFCSLFALCRVVFSDVDQIVEHDESERHGLSHEKSCYHLPERVLSQDHSAGAHHSCHDEHKAEPPQGVEIEEHGKGLQRSCHASNGRCVCGYLPPDVYHGAAHLYGEGRHEDDAHEMGNVCYLHERVTARVTENGDDIRHHALLLTSQFEERPAVILAVGAYEERGHENGEQIHHAYDAQLILPRRKTEVAEGEKHDKSYR